ncbi:MAG: radical SAM protein [Planctomycetes bacterium]|nr:radical SAM protein [Planctomycetota bacterium]
MKVALINVSQVEVYGNLSAVRPTHPPLGLAYLASYIERTGHKPFIIDQDALGMTDEQMIQKLAEERPGMVGITVVTPSFPRATRVAARIKQALPDTPVVQGGIHPTIVPRDALVPDPWDIVVKGEGEETLAELVAALEAKRPLDGIRGVLFKRDGQIVENPPCPLIPDLDVLPFPARHLYPNIRYSYPDAMEHPVQPIFTSRGCPANCTYCQTKNIFTRKFRVHSARYVVDEIEECVNKYGAREIHIWDDNFTTRKDRVLEIRDEIKRRGIRVKFAFPNGLRADYINFEVLKALVDMGAYSISFGIESGNDKVLKFIEKGESLDRVRQSVRWAQQVGLEVWGFFMLGFPIDTRETMQDTIDFAKELDVDVAKFHILQPYPGSKVYYQLEEMGLITNRNYEDYGIHTRPVHKLPGLTEDDILAIQKSAYRQFYLRPRKVWQHLKRVRSIARLRSKVKMGLAILKVCAIGSSEKRLAGEYDSPAPGPDRKPENIPSQVAVPDWKQVQQRIESLEGNIQERIITAEDWERQDRK